MKRYMVTYIGRYEAIIEIEANDEIEARKLASESSIDLGEYISFYLDTIDLEEIKL